jgi:hypothetical protein
MPQRLRRGRVEEMEAPTNASTAGATPKLITSASESSSRPNSLVVFVSRAMRPSSPSQKIAMPIIFAASSMCALAPRLPRLADIAPSIDSRIARKPRKILAAVKNVGSA